MNQVFGNRASEATGWNLAEANADGEQAIAFAKRILSGRHGRAAESHAGMQWMIAWKCGQSLQRHRYRRPENLGDPRHFIAHINGAPAHENSGRFRRGQQFHGFANFFFRIHQFRIDRREFGYPVGCSLKELDIHRNLHQHRTGHSAYSRAIRFENHGHDITMLHDSPRALRDSRDQFSLIEFVKLISKIDIGTRSSGNHQKRDAIQIAFADTAHGMRDAGCWNDNQASDSPVSSAAHGIGGERSAAFMRDQDGADLFRSIQLIVKLSIVDAWNPKSVRDRQLLQRIPRQRRARFRCSRSHNDFPSTRPERTHPPRNVPSSEPLP